MKQNEPEITLLYFVTFASLFSFPLLRWMTEIEKMKENIMMYQYIMKENEKKSHRKITIIFKLIFWNNCSNYFFLELVPHFFKIHNCEVISLMLFFKQGWIIYLLDKFRKKYFLIFFVVLENRWHSSWEFKNWNYTRFYWFCLRVNFERVNFGLFWFPCCPISK